MESFLKKIIDEIENLMQGKPSFNISIHGFNEKNMEGFNESDSTLRSIVVFQQKKFKLPI